MPTCIQNKEGKSLLKEECLVKILNILSYLFNQFCFCDRNTHYLIESLCINQKLIADDLYKLPIIYLRNKNGFKIFENVTKISWKRPEITQMRMTYCMAFNL